MDSRLRRIQLERAAENALRRGVLPCRARAIARSSGIQAGRAETTLIVLQGLLQQMKPLSSRGRAGQAEDGNARCEDDSHRRS